MPHPTGVLLSSKTVLLDGHPHSILLWLDRCFLCHKLITFEQQHLDPLLALSIISERQASY